MQPLSEQTALFGINNVGSMLSDILKQELHQDLQAVGAQIGDINLEYDRILKILRGSIISDMPKQKLYRTLQAASFQIEDIKHKQDEILKILNRR